MSLISKVLELRGAIALSDAMPDSMASKSGSCTASEPTFSSITLSTCISAENARKAESSNRNNEFSATTLHPRSMNRNSCMPSVMWED